MKVAGTIAKIVAIVLAVAAAVCCVIAYWDKIEAAFYWVKEKLCRRRCIESEECVDWEVE